MTNEGVGESKDPTPKVLGLGRRRREQQLRFGNEQLSVQDWVRPWAEMSRGCWTPSVSAGDKLHGHSPQAGLAQQWTATCLPALAVCLHQVSWVLILELLEGQVGIGVQGQAGNGGPDLALPGRADPGEAGPLPWTGARHLLSCFSQLMLWG